MNKYEIIIYWSDEDNVYIAEVPELLGCMTHGDTRAAALANAEEAIQLWVDTAKEFGNAVPEPKGRSSSTDSTTPDPARSERKQLRQAPLSVRRKNKPSIYYDTGKSQPSMNPRAR